MALPTPSTDGLSGAAGTPFPVSLGGRNYVVDLIPNSQTPYVEQTIPLLHNQFISEATKQVENESSLNPQDLIRRGWNNWNMGSGQLYADKVDSVAGRYYTSTNVDPWSRWQLSLLPATRSLKTLTTVVYDGVCSTGARLWLADGTNVYYTTDSLVSGAPTWTALTGSPGTNVVSLTTDGFNIFACFAGGGVYKGDNSSGALTQIYAGTLAKLMYLKDRLYGLNGGGVIYNLTDYSAGAKALPTSLYDKGTNWVWTSGGEGVNHVYFGGYFNDHSMIYKATIKPEGTAMDTPTIAATLPDGEQVVAMCGYLGYLLIGTNTPYTTAPGAATNGVRLAQIQSDGNLVVGPRIETTSYVFAFEPQDSFVWFSWLTSSTDSGIGRIDLARFTDDLKPAYANDVRFSGSGLNNVIGICSHKGRRVFRVDAQNLVTTDDSNIATSGDISFGRVRYGIGDTKVAMYVDVQMSGTGTVAVKAGADGGALTSYGTLSSSGTVDLSALSGRDIEVALTLTRSAGTSGPTVQAVTLRSFIAAPRTREFTLPLKIWPRMVNSLGVEFAIPDTRAEIDALAAMVGTVVVFKHGTKTEYAQVKDYEWIPEFYDVASGQFGGTCSVKIQVVHS